MVRTEISFDAEIPGLVLTRRSCVPACFRARVPVRRASCRRVEEERDSGRTSQLTHRLTRPITKLSLASHHACAAAFGLSEVSTLPLGTDRSPSDE
jgi:hypothetical protein